MKNGHVSDSVVDSDERHLRLIWAEQRGWTDEKHWTAPLVEVMAGLITSEYAWPEIEKILGKMAAKRYVAFCHMLEDIRGY